MWSAAIWILRQLSRQWLGVMVTQRCARCSPAFHNPDIPGCSPQSQTFDMRCMHMLGRRSANAARSGPLCWCRWVDSRSLSLGVTRRNGFQPWSMLCWTRRATRRAVTCTTSCSTAASPGWAGGICSRCRLRVTRRRGCLTTWYAAMCPLAHASHERRRSCHATMCRGGRCRQRPASVCPCLMKHAWPPAGSVHSRQIRL